MIAVGFQVAQRELAIPAVRAERVAAEGGRPRVGRERQVTKQRVLAKRLQGGHVLNQSVEGRHGALESRRGGGHLRLEQAARAIRREPQADAFEQRLEARALRPARRLRRELRIPDPVDGGLHAVEALAQQPRLPVSLRAGRDGVAGRAFRQAVEPPLAGVPEDAPPRREALQSLRPAQGHVIQIRGRAAFEGGSLQPGSGQQLAALGQHGARTGQAEPRQFRVQRSGCRGLHDGLSATNSTASGPAVRRAGS